MGIRSRSRERTITTFLRHMERGRFLEAAKTLRKDKRCAPPPHCLWRLGRWCLDKQKPKDALLPLKLFLSLYPNHLDRPAVMHDLARTLALLGKRRDAEHWAEQAKQSGQRRQKQRREEHRKQTLAAGKAK